MFRHLHYQNMHLKEVWSMEKSLNNVRLQFCMNFRLAANQLVASNLAD